MAISKIGTNSIDTLTSISFAASQTASADANTLDDYEEGLVTMAFNTGAGSATIKTANDSLAYTKIGRMV